MTISPSNSPSNSPATSATASSPASPFEAVAGDNSLPLPRLVLRLGGLGNQRFGDKNGIAESSTSIQQSIEAAIRVVLKEIESCMAVIHEQDRNDNAYHWPHELSGIKSVFRSLLCGKDRWGIEKMRGQSLPVFSNERPLITLCTGTAAGADTILASLVQERSSQSLEYQTIWITPEAPHKVPEGLGIGSVPDKLPDNEASSLDREAVRRRSAIARQHAFGYRAQSEALRHHSDVLIAVWDPDAEGKAGGTSESVAAALSERVPVIAIRIRGEAECDITVLVSPQDLRLLNGVAKREKEETDSWQEKLLKVLTGILQFPDPDPERSAHGHKSSTCYHPRAAFHVFREGQTFDRIWTERLWTIYESYGKYSAASQALHDAIYQHHAGQPLKKPMTQYEEECRNAKAAFLSGIRRPSAVASPSGRETPFVQNSDDKLYRQVQTRAASEGMSGVFGDAHRGGILASYALAAMAVMLAVVGGILHFTHAFAFLQIGLAVAELIVIVLMYAIADASKLEDWNLAYTESRILAEALRLMQHLGPLGVHTPLPKLPYYLKGDSSTPEPDRMWSVWYFRALVRMAPLRLGANATVELQQHRASLATLISGQQKYHSGKAQQHLAVHHDVESASWWLFVLVLLCVILHIVDILVGWHFFAVPGLVVCVGAPALIAALHGLASQVEISRLRQRSSSVARLLEEQEQRIKQLDLQTDPESAETVWTYATEVLSTASLLMDETAGWSMLYRNTDIHAG